MTAAPRLSPLSENDIEALADVIERRQGEADRRKGTGSFMRGDLVKTLLSYVIAALIAWGVVQSRVAVLESRVSGFDAQLAEIRQDIKTLLSRGVR